MVTFWRVPSSWFVNSHLLIVSSHGLFWAGGGGKESDREKEREGEDIWCLFLLGHWY
jgi:hypothetical protein